jgi:hypothetical protein
LGGVRAEVGGKMDAFQVQLPGQKKAVDDDIMQCTIRVEIGQYCVQVGEENKPRCPSPQ